MALLHTQTQTQHDTPYERSPINKLADELIVMIMEYFDNDKELFRQDPIGGNPDYATTLHSCALTQRRWARLAQQVLHRTVHINPDNLERQCHHYGPSSESGNNPYTAGLGLFPRELYIASMNMSRSERWQSLYTFAAYCGDRITRFDATNIAFGSFNNFLNLIGYFPHLKHLALEDCSWGADDMKLWHDCTDFGTCQCAAPSAPASLRHVYVRLLEGTTPLPIAQWLMHSRTNEIEELIWAFKFSLFDDTASSTSGALRLLGTSLTEVVLDVDVSEAWDDDFQQRRYPDLSYNTRLTSVDVHNVVPIYCPRRYLTSIFSKISSRELTRTGVQYVMDDEELGDIDHFALEELEGMLSDRERFPKLGSVIFHAHQDLGRPEGPLFSDFIREKMPALVKCKDIHVQAIRSCLKQIYMEGWEAGDEPGQMILEESHVDAAS